MQLFNRILLLTAFLTGFNSYGQNQESTQYKYHLEYIMGPYLFVDHIPYDAVFMNGCRLGLKMNPHFDFNIEYVVGQNHDDQHTLGMTHNVNGQFAYYPMVNSSPFKPYLFAGGGFFEFKAFTTDVYGVSFHGGGGTLVNFSPRISGLFEARYLNLSQMKLGGEHELAVFWGARIVF